VIEGVDFSSSRPDLACLVQNGKRFVMRYLSHDTGPKTLTAAEAQQIRAAGLALGVVFEDAAGRATQGYQAGVDDARFAAQQLQACGVPPIPIYFAVDQDVDPATVQPYFGGVSMVLMSRTGCYASYRVCAGLNVAKRWQTYAWSGGQQLATADLYQYQNGVTLCGGTVDLTRALSADPGLWGLGTQAAFSNSSEDSTMAYATSPSEGMFLGIAADGSLQWSLNPNGVQGMAASGPAALPDQLAAKPLSVTLAWNGKLAIFEAWAMDVNGDRWVQYYPTPAGGWSGWFDLGTHNPAWRTDPNLLRGPQGPAGPPGTTASHTHGVTVSQAAGTLQGVSGEPR